MAVSAVLQIRPATGAPGDIFSSAAPAIGADPPKATDLQEGDTSVSTQTGALQYSYSIAVPPGRHGAAPQLALSYSSQAPTYGGIAAGWSLSVPIISEDHSQGRLRTRSSLAEAEQVAKGIDPKADDRFVSSMAGGRPLVAVTEPAAVTGDVYMAYRAQNDTSFTRYERMKPGASYRWRARTTDGSVWTFGDTALTTGCVITDQFAPLTSMRDRLGNEVRYVYQQAVAGECRLALITWGRNVGPANLPDFAYVYLGYDPETRCSDSANAQTDYRSGIRRVTGASRLDKIIVVAHEPGNGSAILHTRELRLGYDDAVAGACNRAHAPVRQLTSIRESAWGVDSPRVDLPPVTFEYNDPGVMLVSPQSGGTTAPWGTLPELQNLGWGFRRNDSRWPTVETMFLDIDGDGLQDLVTNASANGAGAISSCTARWYKNNGVNTSGKLTFSAQPQTIALPRLKWRGPGTQPSGGAAYADRSLENREGCALNGQATAFQNSYVLTGGCHDLANPTCKAGSDPLDQAKYCFPGGTYCPPDPGGVANGRFQTYLAYRWLDMDADGLTDLVAAIHGDIDYYDVERGNLPDHRVGEPPMPGIPGLGQWPACTATDRCKQFEDCLAQRDTRSCSGLGCTTHWDNVLDCIATTPTTGCDRVMFKKATGPDNAPGVGVQRSPYERCEGLYPWLIYKNEGNGKFATSPTVKYQPLPLESSSGDSNFTGPSVVSENHAIIDFDGDGWLDAIARATYDAGSGNFSGDHAWQVWLGDGTGGFSKQRYIFPTREWNCQVPCTSFGDNAISGSRGTWGQSVSSAAGLIDANGDGAQDHWLRLPGGNADIAFNKGDELDLYGYPPAGSVKTPLQGGVAVKPGNDVHAVVTKPELPLPPAVLKDPIESGWTVALNRVADVDHDGRVDVVTFAGPNTVPNVFYNLGGQFRSYGIPYPGDVQGITRETRASLSGAPYESYKWELNADLMDLDGDGIQESVSFGTTGFERAPPLSTQPPRLLRIVDNGRGARTAITYSHMHEPGVVEQHPEMKWPDGRPKASPRTQWVVKSLRVTDNLAGTDATTQYSYKNPRFSADDEGHYSFRGFEHVTTTKPGVSAGVASGARTIQTYGYDVDWSGRLIATVVMPSAGEGVDVAHTIEKTRWQMLPLFGGRIKTYHPEYVEQFTCKNAQNAASCEATPAGYTRTTSSWTAYPNTPLPGDEQLWLESGTLLQTAASPSGLTASEGDRQTSQTFELTSTAQQYWQRLYETVQQHRVSGAMVTFAKSRQTWDAVTRTQLTDETWVGSDEAKRAITRYAYDNVGNRTKVWKPEQWAANPNPLTNLVRTTFDYDARRLFVARETNELGHIRDYTYEYGTGTKLRTQGPNAEPSCAPSDLTPCPREESRIRADGLGRTLERFETFARPGESYLSHKVEINTYVDGPAASVTHQSAIDYNEYPYSVRYTKDKTDLDGHGRPIRKTVYVDGSAPANHVTTFSYRHDGTLAEVRVPDPTVNSAATVAYTYTFDSLGRPLTIRRPDATNAADRSGVNLSYDGLSQTSTEVVGAKGGKPATTKTTKDSFGRLVRVDEQLTAGTTPTWATTTYTYDPGDRVAKIVDPENVTTQLEHDYAGRRTKITRAGRAWSYGYDRNDNMLTETSPCTGTGCAASYTTSVAYDALDRPTSKNVAPRNLSVADRTAFGSSEEKYTWDIGPNGKSRLHRWEAKGPGATTPMQVVLPTWNAQGQPYNLDQQFSGAGYANLSRSFRETHYLSGQRATVHYRDVVGTTTCQTGSKSTFTYDARGLPAIVAFNHCDNPAEPTNLGSTGVLNERNVAGLVTKRFSGTGNTSAPFTYVESKWTYDQLGRVTDQTIKKGTALEQVARQTLDYYGNDDPKSMTHWLGTSNQKLFNFEYDQRHQLTNVNAGTAFAATYAYRKSGRFNSANETAAALPGSDVKPRNVTYHYNGVDPEQVTALRSGTTTYASYTYDLAGNQTVRTYPASGTTPAESWTYLYDGKNQLRRVTRRVGGAVTGSEEYWYDHNGARHIVVKRDAAGTKTGMIWFIGDTEAHYNATGSPTQVYAHVSMGTPVARFDRRSDGPSTAEYQFHGLANNTLAAIDQATGRTNTSFVYAPFGEIIEATDAGAPTADGIATHRRRMNDKFVDDVSGLAYYGFRYYDKTAMIWTQSDPLYRFAPDAAWDEPGRAALYTMSLNNPLRYADPDGRNAAAIAGGLATVAEGTALFTIGVALLPATGAALLVTAGADNGVGVDTRYELAFEQASEAKVRENVRQYVDQEIARNNVNETSPHSDGSSAFDEAQPVTRTTADGMGGPMAKPSPINAGPKPNGGNAKPHGGAVHDKAIDQRVAKLKNDPAVSNIRKNQQQVDVNGNKTGLNRPDVQYDKNGKHVCVEFDNCAARSKAHGQTIKAKDPNAKVELNVL